MEIILEGGLVYAMLQEKSIMIFLFPISKIILKLLLKELKYPMN